MKILITVFAVALLFIACENDNEKSLKSEDLSLNDIHMEKPAESISENDYAGFQSDTTVQMIAAKEEKRNPSFPVLRQDWDKKIIKTASLNIEVKEYKKYNASLREKVKQLGGYIAEEEENQSDYKIENVLTIKVPVDQFDNAVNLLSSEVEKVNEKRITSQDVTGEVMDTKSRLEAKKQIRLRYLDLLKQAKNMAEILNVQSEINDIQEEIESAAGRINYLSHSSSLSTIQLTFQQVLNPYVNDYTKPSFGTKLSDAFSIGWNWVGELFIGIISVWPLLLMFFITFIIYKKMKTSKTRIASKLKTDS